MSFRGRLKILSAGAFGLLLAAVATPFALASGSSTTEQATEAPLLVEEFAYPNAEAIQQEKGISLKRGDGHIVMVDCNQAEQQIRVLTVADPSVNRNEIYCFEANHTTGHLTLELPRVFAIEAADQPVSADLTADGAKQTVKVAEGDFVSVGEGTVGGARSVLVELRVTG